MLWRRGLWLGAVCGAAGCGTKPGDSGAAGPGSDAVADSLPPPVENGPGGSVVMSGTCAPMGGEGVQLVVGVGSACGVGAPDRLAPAVRLSVTAPAFMADPLGGPVSWSDASEGSATYWPEGLGGTGYDLWEGTLYLSEWQALDSGRPAGARVAGWYVVQTADGSEVGNSFVGVWCGAAPDCG